MLSELFKKTLEYICAFLLQDTSFKLRLEVVWHLKQVCYGSAGAVFKVVGSEEYLGDMGVKYRAGTHRAGLQRNINLTVPQPPAAKRSAGVVDRVCFSVPKGVLALFAAVPAFCDYLSVSDNNRSGRKAQAK